MQARRFTGGRGGAGRGGEQLPLDLMELHELSDFPMVEPAYGNLDTRVGRIQRRVNALGGLLAQKKREAGETPLVQELAEKTILFVVTDELNRTIPPAYTPSAAKRWREDAERLLGALENAIVSTDRKTPFEAQVIHLTGQRKPGGPHLTNFEIGSYLRVCFAVGLVNLQPRMALKALGSSIDYEEKTFEDLRMENRPLFRYYRNLAESRPHALERVKAGMAPEEFTDNLEASIKNEGEEYRKRKRRRYESVLDRYESAFGEDTPLRNRLFSSLITRLLDVEVDLIRERARASRVSAQHGLDYSIEKFQQGVEFGLRPHDITHDGRVTEIRKPRDHLGLFQREGRLESIQVTPEEVSLFFRGLFAKMLVTDKPADALEALKCSVMAKTGARDEKRPGFDEAMAEAVEAHLPMFNVARAWLLENPCSEQLCGLDSRDHVRQLDEELARWGFEPSEVGPYARRGEHPDEDVTHKWHAQVGKRVSWLTKYDAWVKCGGRLPPEVEEPAEAPMETPAEDINVRALRGLEAEIQGAQSSRNWLTRSSRTAVKELKNMLTREWIELTEIQEEGNPLTPEDHARLAALGKYRRTDGSWNFE